MSDPQISIVICTHRRPELLSDAVQALVNQTASPDLYEVIVVDNVETADESVRGIVESAGHRICARYLHEDRVGLSIGRTVGGQSARADYVGYTDDDARLAPSYVDSLLRVTGDCPAD